jgi:hypothetical protein
MATIVNTPTTADTGANTGMLVGLALAALFLFALLFWGARNWSGGFGGAATAPRSETTINNEAPAGGGVSVPDKIDVNVDTNGAPAQ